jgi:hypothetical protein
MLVGCGKSVSNKRLSAPTDSKRELRCRIFEPKAPIDLTLEEFARQQLVVWVFLVSPGIQPLPVQRGEGERNPANSALDYTKLRLGKRWHTPPQISWEIVRAFSRKNDTPTDA